VKRIDQESSKQSRAFNATNEKDKVIQSHQVIKRRSTRLQQSNELTSSINDLSINSQEEEEEEEENLSQDQMSKFNFSILNN